MDEEGGTNHTHQANPILAALLRGITWTNNLLIMAGAKTDEAREFYLRTTIRDRLALPRGGEWLEILNTDSEHYGGSGVGNLGRVRAEDLPWPSALRDRPHPTPRRSLLRPRQRLTRTMAALTPRCHSVRSPGYFWVSLSVVRERPHGPYQSFSSCSVHSSQPSGTT
ncbi:MAG: alpha amylase C-terminal domain-containing protein [Micrococcales bacterium]|nr:alpha amylase C-terminal domain-containing protein [Micrococcales bacterium]